MTATGRRCVAWPEMNVAKDVFDASELEIEIDAEAEADAEVEFDFEADSGIVSAV